MGRGSPIDRDITARYHGGDSDSIEAHESIKGDKRRQWADVLAFVTARGADGATSYEAECALGRVHQGVSARFAELKRAGLLEKALTEDGKHVKRPTQSRRKAGVWIRSTTPVAPDWRKDLYRKPNEQED